MWCLEIAVAYDICSLTVCLPKALNLESLEMLTDCVWFELCEVQNV